PAWCSLTWHWPVRHVVADANRQLLVITDEALDQVLKPSDYLLPHGFYRAVAGNIPAGTELGSKNVAQFRRIFSLDARVSRELVQSAAQRTTPHFIRHSVPPCYLH